MESTQGANHGAVRDHRYFGGGMAHIYRLVVLALCLFSGSAFASFGGTGATYGVSGWASGTSTPAAVCTYFPGYTFYAVGIGQCYNAGTVIGIVYITQPSCPANSTGTDTCTCNSGFEENATHNGCVVSGGFHADPVCGLYKGVQDGLYEAPYVPGGADSLGSPNGYYTHLCTQTTSKGGTLPGCGLVVNYDIAVSDGAGGYTKQGVGTFTGTACSMDNTSLGTSATGSYPGASGSGAPAMADPCPAGSANGIVNGVTVCSPIADRNTIQADKSISTTTGATGTAIDPLAPATATGKSSTTSCSGSTCTTTTTFTASNGTVAVGTSTSTDTLAGYCGSHPGSAVCGDPAKGSDFCADHPTSIVCVNGTFSGTCGATPTCTGDAVQCAVAKAVFDQDCIFKTTSAESALYDAKKGLTGDQTTALPGNESVAISSSSFSQSNDLGGAGGISDLSITVMGRSVTLAFSQLNTWFSTLGYLLMGVTALLCVRIVARG